MSAPVFERGIVLQPKYEGIEVLVGDQVAVHDAKQQEVWAGQVHEALGNTPFVYQPDRGRIREGMEGGDFVLAVDQNTGLVVATAHLRVAKVDPLRREIGGVVKVDPEARIGGNVIVKTGVDLGMQIQGAQGVELLVAEQNLIGQDFFPRLEGIRKIGKRPSNYLKDNNGVPLPMTVFDATHITGRKLPRGRVV